MNDEEFVGEKMEQWKAKSAPLVHWHNDVVQLAQHILSEDEWGSFPILADAMEEHGFTNVKVLATLREHPLYADNLWVLIHIINSMEVVDAVAMLSVRTLGGRYRVPSM